MSVLFCCSIKSAGIWEIQERSGTGDLSGMVQAYLKRSGTSEVREIDLEGKELRKYSKKNEDIAAECLKYQRSRGKERQPMPEEILRHKPDVNLKKR